MEIEKRFILDKKSIPFDEIISKVYIEQSYSVNNDVVDVRIRKSTNEEETKYTHTTKYKTENKNIRIEIESEINNDEYDKIFSLINKTPLRKNRYFIPYNNLTIEIDEFLDLDKFVAEVEFKNEEDMNSFEKPKWFGKEIKTGMFSGYIFSYLNSKDIYEKIKLSKYINFL